MDVHPKACVILGAGASHDVKGEGSPCIDPTFQPPLARDLFNIAGHPEYWSVIEDYPGASALVHRLASHISSGQISVESELKRYADHSDPQIRSHFKYIPPYLRDLLYYASVKYTPMPSSYIELAQELISEHQHNVLFIVLNYDNLLEQALQGFYPKFTFNSISEYVTADRPAKVVKLHGSVNWFKQMPRLGRDSWDEALERFDPSTETPENEIIVKNWEHPVRAYTVVNKPYIYPLLTAPLAGKGVSDAICPDSHINVAKEFLRDCQKFLIIGTSGLDEDLLALVDSSLSDSMVYRHIHIVNYGSGGDEAYKKFARGIKVFSDRIDVRNVFREGFRKYLQDGLKSFSEYRL